MNVPATPLAREGGSWLARVGRLAAPFVGLMIVLVVFTAIEPEAFLSLRNGRTIAIQTVVVGIGALGMCFVIVAGGIDLSIGSVIALAGVVGAMVMEAGGGATTAVLAADRPLNPADPFFSLLLPPEAQHGGGYGYDGGDDYGSGSPAWAATGGPPSSSSSSSLVAKRRKSGMGGAPLSPEQQAQQQEMNVRVCATQARGEQTEGQKTLGKV